MKSKITSGTKGNTAQISVRKINARTTYNLAKATTHNRRIGETESHVDERRTQLNERLVGKEDENLYCDIVNRIVGKNLTTKEVYKLAETEIRYQDGEKVRKDAVLAFECKCQYPGDLAYANIDEHGQIYLIPEGEEIDPRSIEDGGRGDFLYPLDQEEFAKWKALTLKFVEQRFGGSENVLQAVCHMDETVPHLHIIGAPFYRDEKKVERLSMKKYLNGRMETSQLQTEYVAALSELGYKRGEHRGYSVNDKTATQARALIGNAIASAPRTPEEFEKMIAGMTSKEGMEMLQGLHLKVAIANELTKEVPKLQAVVKKKTEMIDKMRADMQVKDAELEQAKKQLATYQREHLRRLCELQGVQLSEDRELVEAYLEAQDYYTDLGKRSFERGGLQIDLSNEMQLDNSNLCLDCGLRTEDRE